jgi:hypothetical protein
MMNRNFLALAAAVHNAVVEEDGFGTGRWAYLSPAEAVDAFSTWLRHEVNQTILGVYQESVWRRHVKDAVDKGIQSVSARHGRGSGDAFSDITYVKPDHGARVGDTVDATGGSTPATDPSQSEHHAYRKGQKAEFHRAVGIRVQEIVKVLQDQAFQEVRNMVDALVNRCRRDLSQALVNRRSAAAISKSIILTLNHHLTRSIAIAHTEITRAHADGQLAAFEHLGAQEVEVEPEWVAADEACTHCIKQAGLKYTVKQARGLIPFHVNCMCCWRIAK